MGVVSAMIVAAGVLVALPGWAQTRDEVREEADEAARETERTAEEAGEAAEDTAIAAEEVDDELVEIFGRRGVAVSAGLGLLGYANNETNDFIDPGASYTARIHIGTEERIAWELAYLGSAASIDALGLDSSAILMSNAVEGNFRYNFSTDATWQPYVSAGAAWRRYSITNADFNTSSANDSDTVFEVPLGAGIVWRSGGGLIIDGRLGYRLATFEDLLGGGSGGGPALDNWHIGARAGWEF